MKNIALNIWEAIVFTFFYKKPLEHDVEETIKTDKELENSNEKATLFLVKDYENTVVAKNIFLVSAFASLLASFWFVFVLANLFACVCLFVLSLLLAKLYVNRATFQAIKYSYIQFDISMSVELEKTKNPDYQMREPGFYKDNF